MPPKSRRSVPNAEDSGVRDQSTSGATSIAFLMRQSPAKDCNVIGNMLASITRTVTTL